MRPRSDDESLLGGACPFSIRTLARGRFRRPALEPRKGLPRLHQLRLAQRPAAPRPGFRRSPEAARPPRRQIRDGTRLRPVPQAEARQPVGQSVETRWAAQRPYPPALDPFGHVLRRGSGGKRRNPLRRSAPANDDGGPGPPRRRARGTAQFVTVEPRPGLLLMWESWLRHEVLPGTGQGRPAQHQLQFRVKRGSWS